MFREEKTQTEIKSFVYSLVRSSILWVTRSVVAASDVILSNLYSPHLTKKGAFSISVQWYYSCFLVKHLRSEHSATKIFQPAGTS